VRSRLISAAFISDEVDRAWVVEELEDEEVMWWCKRWDFFSTRVVVLLLLLTTCSAKQQTDTIIESWVIFWLRFIGEKMRGICGVQRHIFPSALCKY